MPQIRLLCITFLLIFTSLLSFAQQFSTISGTVTTSDGKPAAYISVGLKGKGLGNVTNRRVFSKSKELNQGLIP